MEVVCRAIILFQDKILLCKQKNPPRNYWALPGGHLEEGETLTDCVSRETYEELGVHLKVDQMLFIRELIDHTRHRIEFYFSVKAPDDFRVFDDVMPCNEIGEARFFTLNSLQTIIVKPDCLPNLIQETISASGVFPKYLGNIS